MLRGHRTYLSLFQNDSPAEVLAVPEKRGRSEQLIIKRNELLIHRHYFYYKIKGLQYHIGLQALESEFFLTERTIVDIVQNNHGIIKELRNLAPEIHYFKKKYPFMAWDR